MSASVTAAAKNAAASVTTQLTISFTASAGDAIVVIASTYNQQPTLTVSDGVNSYSSLGSTVRSGLKVEMFAAQNVAAGAVTVAVAVSTATSFLTIIGYLITGVAASCYNGDFKAGDQASTSTPSTGTTPSAAAANSLAIGGVSTSGADNSITDGSGWTRPANGANTNNSTLQDLYTQYKIVSGTYSSDWTDSGTVLAESVTASFAPLVAATINRLPLLGVS